MFSLLLAVLLLWAFLNGLLVVAQISPDVCREVNGASHSQCLAPVLLEKTSLLSSEWNVTLLFQFLEFPLFHIFIDSLLLSDFQIFPIVEGVEIVAVQVGTCLIEVWLVIISCLLVI